MALSSFLKVNGVKWPCPAPGFSYTLTRNVDAGRNTSGAVIGQLVGRELIALDEMEWHGLTPQQWQAMLNSLNPFYVQVELEDYRTGQPMTVWMYPGDKTATPLFADPVTHKVTRYDVCSVHLIDCGW